MRGADSEGKKRAGGKHRTGRLDWEGVQRFITREHKECSQVLKYLRGCNECKEDAAAHFDLQAHRRTITQTQRFTGTSYTCRNVTMRKCKENIAGFATLFVHHRVSRSKAHIEQLLRGSVSIFRRPRGYDFGLLICRIISARSHNSACVTCMFLQRGCFRMSISQ